MSRTSTIASTRALTLLFFISILTLQVAAQTQTECGFDPLHKARLLSDPDYRERVEHSHQKIENYVNSSSGAQGKIIGSVLEVPVVVHVIHTGTAVGVGDNISDGQIDSAIAVLNDRFRKTPGTHGDAAGVDSEIQFVLANRDPDCNTSDGIVRVNGSSVTNYATQGIEGSGGTGADELEVKNLSRWPNTDYVNIWVVSEIDNNNGGAGTQGYAYYPGASQQVDGIVVMNSAFGVTGTVKSYTNMGKTITHEMGHYLGLYHTFEGDDDGNSCPPVTNGCGSDSGDCISDTDPHIRSASNCPSGTNSCTGSALGTIVNNYMDYSSQTCADMFTQGQRVRMRASIWATRSGLLTSKGYLAPDTFSVTSAFCTPQTDSLDNGYGIGIRNLSLDSLDVSSDGAVRDSGYVDRMCNQWIYLDTNTTYNISITTGSANNEDVRVFIDYNNDGDFDETGEDIFSSDTDVNHSGNFTTPSSPTFNEKLRLRVISDFHGNTSSLNAGGSCYDPQYGQVEDYGIIFADTTASSGGASSGAAAGGDDGPGGVGSDTNIAYWLDAEALSLSNNEIGRAHV